MDSKRVRRQEAEKIQAAPKEEDPVWWGGRREEILGEKEVAPVHIRISIPGGSGGVELVKSYGHSDYERYWHVKASTWWMLNLLVLFGIPLCEKVYPRL